MKTVMITQIIKHGGAVQRSSVLEEEMQHLQLKLCTKIECILLRTIGQFYVLPDNCGNKQTSLRGLYKIPSTSKTNFCELLYMSLKMVKSSL